MTAVLDELTRWVEVPSTSGSETAFLDLLEKDLAADGFRVESLPVPGGRRNLLATMGDAPPRVLLCSHADTVPPHIPPTTKGTTLWGRGTADAKGCLLAMRRALKGLGDAARGAGLLAVVSEETDHAGAKAVHASGRKVERLVLGEPTRNRFLPGQKGVLKVRVTAKGKAAHSAFPARGKSAIHALVRELDAILGAHLPTDPRFGENTLNIGHIAGGVADNVFAPVATATIMYRVTMPARDLFRILKGWSSDEVKVEYVSGNDPLEFSVPGWGKRGEVAAFNTDGPYLKGCFREVFLVGPGDIEVAHSEKERVSAAQLAAAEGIYARLVTEGLA